MNPSPNPKYNSIRQSCVLGYQRAGVSIQGLLAWWRHCADPGRAAFWRQTLIELGVAPAVVSDTIEALERASRSEATALRVFLLGRAA